MTNKTYRYVGQSFKQGDAEHEIVTFVASATDIKRWSGVPQKTSHFHGGFQRALASRYKKIIKYFNNKESSPTSIVVAFRPDKLQTGELPLPSNWPDLEAFDNRPNFVDITFHNSTDSFDELSLSELREEVASMLRHRIENSQDSIENALDEMEENDDVNEDDSTEEGSLISDENIDDELDVGHSKLKLFYDFIVNTDAVESWLKQNSRGYESAQEELMYLLVSMLRPAMIVDGQHRVWGAYESDNSHNIQFTVNALKDADWIEQVFQFVVLNKLAKPITPSFLTSILNTSLTNSEVNEIEQRLEFIGITNSDRTIMKYLNHDERSPFYDWIADPGEMIGTKNEGKLSDKGMIRLMKRWRSIDHPTKTQELRMLMPAISEEKLSNARRKWKRYETWVPFFYAFWESIKSKYERAGVWEKQKDFKLLHIVTMHCLQDMFLEKKSQADVKFKCIDDLKEQVEEFFEPVPATFFQNWDATGLQSGNGPETIKDAIQMFKEGKTLSTVKKNSPLFNLDIKKS